MKQSSIEPPKKKLKQARLPFQILSPGVTNPPASPTQQRKRKASESPLDDDDVKISKIPGVKENHVTPVEKRIKVVNGEGDVATTNIKNNEIGNKNEKGVEIQEEKANKGEKLFASKPEGAKKKISKPKSYSKKSTKAVSGRKKQNPGTKQNNNSKPTTGSDETDIVDLCDSPCKSETEDGKSTASTAVPTAFKVGNSPTKAEEKEKKTQASDVLKNVKPQTNSEKEDFQKAPRKGSKSGENKNLESSEQIISKLDGDTSTRSVEETELKIYSKTNTKIEEQKDDTKSILIKDDQVVNEKLTRGLDKIIVLKEPSLEDRVAHKSSEIDDNQSSLDKNIHDNNGNSDTISSQNTPSKNKTTTNNNSLDPKISPSSSSVDDSPQTPLSVNESLKSADVSSTSGCSTPTSISGTPLAKKFKSPMSTPRRMTPKQLAKFKEREERSKEKERMKLEKEKKKTDEKEERLRLKQEKEEEKLKQKQDKEEERLKLKQEKEDEKRKEREEKEKKKQAELEQKNEEKRLKEEEKRVKEEERKKKEEEEKKKKEEKRLKEEQKLAEKRKSAQAFASFFVKSETKTASADEEKENAPVESNFQPFEVKNDMRLAPVARVQLTEERREVLDSVIERVTLSPLPRLYLEHVHSPLYARGVAPRTWPPPDDTDDDVIIIESEKTNEEMETDCDETVKKSEKKHQRAKLLQFHENRRPPYWGTWRKKSQCVRPRAPLVQDKVFFEYDVDSDDEWEEPEDGESLRGSEDEESQDEQYEEDNDMFVPHGYLSDEEGQDEFDDKSPEAMKDKLKFLQMEFEAERSEKQERLKPRLIGCVWFCNSESDSAAIGSQIAELFLSRRAVWEGSLPVVVAAPLPTSPTTPTDTDTEESRGCKRKLVPEYAIPDIIKKVHGNRMKLSKLLGELLEELQGPAKKPSKRCLADKIREMASWQHSPETGHHCWYVKEEVRLAHGLMDLNIKPSPCSSPLPAATNITKFTKVLTSDERLKLLREPPANNSPKDSSKAAQNSVPSTPNSKQTSNVKTPTVKLPTQGKALSSVKKRVALLSSAPLVHHPPKQSPSTMKNFVQTLTKPAKCEGNTNTTGTEKATTTVKTEEKAKKRITPIALTTIVPKPHPQPPPTAEETIVLSD